MKKTIAMLVRLLASAIIVLCIDMHARTVGSNSLVARQKEAFFNTGESNSLLGFSVFEGGVTLQDQDTVCEIDVFFPLSGPLVLNGGTLTLKRDLIFRSPFYLGSGKIDADSYAIEFPRNISDVQIPCSKHKHVLSLVAQIDAVADINSVDWSFDNKYVAVGIDGTNSGDELRIYSFDGNTLTLADSYSFSKKAAYAVRWHPSDYYVAVGKTSNSELYIFHFNTTTEQLSVTDSKDIDTVYAVAWHPNGTHLAVGQSNNTDLLIYPVTNGVLGSAASVSVGSSRSVCKNALDWSSDGNYLAVGLSKRGNEDDCLVYAFDGTNLSLNASTLLDQNVFAVAWQPGASRIAIGTDGGSERLRLYEHNAQSPSLTEVTSARVGESRRVYGLSWNASGSLLAASRSNDSNGFETKIFAYDATTKALSVTTGVEIGRNTESIRFSPNGNYVAAGDRSDMLRVYALEDTPLVFKDAKLFFGSDVTVTTTVCFEGVCVVNASDNAIDLTNGMFAVADNASLYVENASLKGIKENKIYCTNNTGVVSLRDVEVVLDGNTTFSTGALLFQDEVFITGDATFAYQSAQTSTILEKSQLTLDYGITFSYDPPVASNDLLQLTDDTSKIILNSATFHTTTTGYLMNRGVFEVRGKSFISAEGETEDVGFIFGDAGAGTAVNLKINPAATLEYLQGCVQVDTT